MVDDREIRLIRDARKIEDILSSEFLPPTQSHKIRIKSSLSQLIFEEEKRWSTCPMPQLFRRGSPEDWLLSCPSWKTDRTSIISPPGGAQRQQLGLVVTIAPPHSSAQSEQRKNSSSQFFPGKRKSWSIVSNALLWELPKRMASILPILRVLGI